MLTTHRESRSSRSRAGSLSGRTAEAKADDGGTRLRLIQATVQIMHDEGYAAATSRRVAAKAGVRQALVYYYFPTMDDLFLEVLKVGADTLSSRCGPR